MSLDLFGQPIAAPIRVPVEDRKHVSIRVRVFNFFHERKYEAFTVTELLKKEQLTKISPISMRRAVDQLMKSRKLISTGELRGPGRDNLCLTFNLHRRTK